MPIDDTDNNHLNTWVLVLACILVAWHTFMVLLSLLGQYVGQTRYKQKLTPQTPQMALEHVPGVSILRPLKGIDLELEENLRSSFEQRYPKFEIIFSIASPNDPAIPIVERLMKEYKEVDSRLIIGDKCVGINPKINNMIESYHSAKHDIIWILDSNVRVDRDTMGRSVDLLLEPGIGLVHHLPIAVDPASYAAEVEQVFLDTNHAKMYLAINWVGVASCVMGKSNLYRRSDLDKVGGLEAFGKYMAEDNLVGEALWHQGLRHRMSSDTACQVLGPISPKGYCARRARWVRLRKYIVTAATLTEPFTESIVCGLLGALGYRLLFGISAVQFFLVHWSLWFVNDLWLFRTLNGAAPDHRLRQPIPAPFAYGKFLRAWLSREVLALPLYMYAMFGTQIAWRDQQYRCLSDGTAVAISSDDTFHTTALLTNSINDDDKTF
ncbi:glycosyl transferase family 21-domain-containing protein [Radiomyces spectabilis]|uniref:glycosyl transferase family 21-domain-containing protein n=1 Tax=Radiomyces spectabilis TaxID=64574 RepID=UPI00221ECE2F|nr:glycosyl transferase family 21-domain-containing protein [Radiomyces spectabilis]KAI8391505.1 glycosyl transferase family 21-domain-containing protein [Radiomyces spectabilis]